MGGQARPNLILGGGGGVLQNVHTRMHAHTHVCTHMYMLLNVHVRMHTHTHTCMHASTCTHTFIHLHPNMKIIKIKASDPYEKQIYTSERSERVLKGLVIILPKSYPNLQTFIQMHYSQQWISIFKKPNI